MVWSTLQEQSPPSSLHQKMVGSCTQSPSMGTRSGSQGLNRGPACAKSPFTGTRSGSHGLNPGPVCAQSPFIGTRSGSHGLNPGPVYAHSPFIGTRSRSQGINPGPDYIFPLPSPSVGGGLGAKLKMWVPCATNRQMFKACTATTTKSSKQNQLICQKSAYIGASWIV